MRKHFRHGKSSVANQFVVRSDKHTCAVVEGKLVVTIKVAQKFGGHITLVTTSSGKNVNLTGSNLRIVVKDGFTEIHYAGSRILLARSPAQLSVNRLELGAKARQPSADKSSSALNSFL